MYIVKSRKLTAPYWDLPHIKPSTQPPQKEKIEKQGDELELESMSIFAIK